MRSEGRYEAWFAVVAAVVAVVVPLDQRTNTPLYYAFFFLVPISAFIFVVLVYQLSKPD